MIKKYLFMTLFLMITITFSVYSLENPKSIKELTAKAERIIIGQVVKQSVEWNSEHSQIFTTLTVNVEEQLKGDDNSTSQVIKIPGGKVGDMSLKVSSAPTFATGEKALFFLSSVADGAKEKALIGWKKQQTPKDRISLLAAKREINKYLGKSEFNNLPEKIQCPDANVLMQRAKKFKPKMSYLSNQQTEIEGDWGWKCVWGDDFEGDFPGTNWIMGRNGNPGVNNGYTWGKTSYNPFAGEYAVWCAETNLIPGNPDLEAGVDNYPDNTQAWMIAGPFDLSDVYSARLSFQIDQTVEPFRNVPPADPGVIGPVDWSAVGFSIDGVWFYLGPDFQFFYTSTGGYISYEINIEDVIGPLWDKNQVWICFIFWTDFMNTDRGTWIDNVKLKKFVPQDMHPQITCVKPKKQSAGTGNSITITGSNFGEYNEGDPDSKVEFFGGFYWWGDTMWVPSGFISRWDNETIICDVPSDASSGKLRVRRPKEGVVYHDFDISFGFTGSRWNIGVGTALGTEYPIVPFKVNPFTCNSCAPAQVLADIINSANTWNVQGNAMVHLQFAGPSSVTEAKFDGENTVLFDQYSFPGSPSVTYLYTDGSGNILEADIILNALYPWCHDAASAPFPSCMVISNWATHEFGNFLGLTNLYGEADKEKTMYGFTHWDDIPLYFLDEHAADLHPEDIEGLQWIYSNGFEVNFSFYPTVGVSPLTVNFVNKTRSKYPIASYFWDFGNGQTSTGQNPIVVFTAPAVAEFDVSLTATDVYGNTNSMTVNKAVKLNQRIAAGIYAEPTVGFGPLTVQFENRTIGDAESFLWDFGDGTTSTDKNPNHTYIKPGVYSVSLTSSRPGCANTQSVAGLIEVYDDLEHLGFTYLELVDQGGESWAGEGWGNAIDHCTFHTPATASVKGDHPWAIFTFDDGFVRKINKVRMMADTGVEGKEGDWVTDFTIAVSTDGVNFTDIGTFRKTSGNWEEFTFDPVEALFVKLTCEADAHKWQQIGEFEVYEHINVPDISGSVLTASSPHIANGYDAAGVKIVLADADGNRVTGLSPSYFRISATGRNNYPNLVSETDEPGVYLGSFSSLTAEEKTVSVRIGGLRLSSSTIDAVTPVIVNFTAPELTKETLVLQEGTDTWRGESWDKAIDGDTTTQVAAIKFGGCYGIYKFADEGERAIIMVRLFRGTGNGHPEQLVTEYRVSTSKDGTNFTELFRKSTSATEWEQRLSLPVMSKFIKIELLNSDDSYRAFSELEVYTTPLIGDAPNAMGQGAASKSSRDRIPTKYALCQNYPNPFNPETMISFDIPEAARVTLQVYNLMGQVIRTLVNEKKTVGRYQIMWDGRDDNGANVASGIYFYNIKAVGETKTFSQRMKMMLLR